MDRDTLVLSLTVHARVYARQQAKRRPWLWGKADDLAQFLLLEVMRVADRYDPSKGSPQVWAKGVWAKARLRFDRNKEEARFLPTEFLQKFPEPEGRGEELAVEEGIPKKLEGMARPGTLLFLLDCFTMGRKDVAEKWQISPYHATTRKRDGLARLRSKAQKMQV
jgi:DNA-directed RNA polymerase specialized sigma24 family protein